MYGPEKIMEWIEANVKPMRRSRQKTLSAIVAAAMEMRGIGVLSLGRTMSGNVAAKHCIKRVGRFFCNEKIERESVFSALSNNLVGACQRRVVVLVDWTDHGPYKTLVAALPRDGRALPVWWRTISKESGEGVMKATERACLSALKELFVWNSEVIAVADRGFGNTRWMRDAAKLGMGFVQRVSGSMYVENAQYYRTLKDLPTRRGEGCRDWREVRLTKEEPLGVRLVTAWSAKTREPWYLATNLRDIPQEISRIYQRRMWIEEMFRDLKNRSWGLGMTDCILSTPERQDHMWCIMALAYFFLCAFGAAAEQIGLDAQFKPNTEGSRVLNLARMGSYFLLVASMAIPMAVKALNQLPP
jgi:hypothetical protein